MSRTQRYHSRWLRSGPATQQERRQYFAALDQEIPIRVRGKRRPNHLPDSRSELRSSSYRQTIDIHGWLLKRLGQRWDRIQRAAAVTAPNLKPSPRNREVLTGAVYAQTHQVGETDESNAANLPWALQRERPNGWPITVGGRWKNQFVQGRPGKPSDRTAGASTGQPEVFWAVN